LELFLQTLDLIDIIILIRVKLNVFKLLEEKQLYEKSSKFFFGEKEVEYLGLIVSHEGVKADPNKIKSIKTLKITTTLMHI